MRKCGLYHQPGYSVGLNVTIMLLHRGFELEITMRRNARNRCQPSSSPPLQDFVADLKTSLDLVTRKDSNKTLPIDGMNIHDAPTHERSGLPLNTVPSDPDLGALAVAHAFQARKANTRYEYHAVQQPVDRGSSARLDMAATESRCEVGRGPCLALGDYSIAVVPGPI